MRKLRFFASFLVSFGALLTIWGQTRAAGAYTNCLLTIAAAVGPMIHGWVLNPPPAGQQYPVWVRGADEVRAAMQFDSISVGLVPLLALLAATPGVPVRIRLLRMGVGAALNSAVLALILALFPLLVFYKNAFTDVIGTFLGLVAFVGLPVIIWFALSFREIRRLLPPFAVDSAGRGCV